MIGPPNGTGQSCEPVAPRSKAVGSPGAAERSRSAATFAAIVASHRRGEARRRRRSAATAATAGVRSAVPGADAGMPRSRHIRGPWMRWVMASSTGRVSRGGTRRNSWSREATESNVASRGR